MYTFDKSFDVDMPSNVANLLLYFYVMPQFIKTFLQIWGIAKSTKKLTVNGQERKERGLKQEDRQDRQGRPGLRMSGFMYLSGLNMMVWILNNEQ